jgi:hypothetical protein
MVSRRRYRADYPGIFGVAMFGSVGWLFADLMAAIAMAFLVANTVGSIASPRPPKPHVKLTPRPTPSPTPTPTQGPALDLNYVCVPLTVDNPQALISGDPSEADSVRSQITSVAALKSQQAGLVLLFGGDPDSPQGDSQAISLDNAVIQILQGLGQQNYVFEVAVYRKFLGLNQPQTSVELNVYLFKSRNGVGEPTPAAENCPGANTSG